MTWIDSENVLHARQALNAYEHQRAQNNLSAAREHLLHAIDYLTVAEMGIKDEMATLARNRA